MSIVVGCVRLAGRHRLGSVHRQPLLPLVIVVTMFAIGWMLPPDEVRQVIKRWPLVLAGTTLQYCVDAMAGLVGCLGVRLGRGTCDSV